MCAEMGLGAGREKGENGVCKWVGGVGTWVSESYGRWGACGLVGVGVQERGCE